MDRYAGEMAMGYTQPVFSQFIFHNSGAVDRVCYEQMDCRKSIRENTKIRFVYADDQRSIYRSSHRTAYGYADVPVYRFSALHLL